MCDANNSIGFGHVSRCIYLAKYSLKINKKIKIGFIGSYIKEVKYRIKNSLLDIDFIKNKGSIKSKCLVIDALGDDDDPNIFPLNKYNLARTIANNIIYLSSGTQIDKLPTNIICIGYHPSGIKSKPPNIYWDLKYAPTLEVDYKNLKKRNKNNVLLALGGIRDESLVNTIMEVVNQIDLFKQIDILVSPVNKKLNRINVFKTSKCINLHYNLKTISPLLFESGMVIATLGNLSYEALAHGAPLCLIATKKFQSEYGDLLKDKGLAYNVGLVNEKNQNKLLEFIKKTLIDSDQLSKQAIKLIDGKGIKRITNIISNYY